MADAQRPTTEPLEPYYNPRQRINHANALPDKNMEVVSNASDWLMNCGHQRKDEFQASEGSKRPAFENSQTVIISTWLTLETSAERCWTFESVDWLE